MTTEPAPGSLLAPADDEYALQWRLPDDFESNYAAVSERHRAIAKKRDELISRRVERESQCRAIDAETVSGDIRKCVLMIAQTLDDMRAHPDVRRRQDALIDAEQLRIATFGNVLGRGGKFTTTVLLETMLRDQRAMDLVEQENQNALDVLRKQEFALKQKNELLIARQAQLRSSLQHVQFDIDCVSNEFVESQQAVAVYTSVLLYNSNVKRYLAYARSNKIEFCTTDAFDLFDVVNKHHQSVLLSTHIDKVACTNSRCSGWRVSSSQTCDCGSLRGWQWKSPIDHSPEYSHLDKFNLDSTVPLGRMTKGGL